MTTSVETMPLAESRKFFLERELIEMISVLEAKTANGEALTAQEELKLKLAQKQLEEGRGHLEKINKLLDFSTLVNKKYNDLGVVNTDFLQNLSTEKIG
jgi:DNA repair exonuclease SbcCD ATPase subunit